jgi:hypothetical protein
MLYLTIMETDNKKLRFFVGLGLFSTLFLFLRISNIGHLLMWDEALNVLALKAHALNALKNPFIWYYNFHPPLYMFFAGLLNPLSENIAIRMEWLSLSFAYATFIVIYIISSRIGGLSYAWLTGFFLCTMPSSIGYDTWIKRDGLASFLGYFAILFLYKKKFYFSALCLGLALLAKENAVFFAFACFAIMPLLRINKIPMRILSIICIMGIFASYWFITSGISIRELTGYYFSEEIYQKVWLNHWTYYFKKLIPDLGFIQFSLVIIGIPYLIFNSIYEKKPQWLIPVIIFVSVYLPISFIFVTKTPWLSLSARGALAMIAAAGILPAINAAKKFKPILIIPFLVILFAGFTGLSFSYDSYHKAVYPNGWPGARSSFDIASYINRELPNNGKYMITEFAYWKKRICPIFVIYSDNIPEKIVKGSDPAEKLIREIKERNISLFVVCNSPDSKHNYNKLIEDFTKLTGINPENIGWTHVWNTSDLWQKNRDNL